MLKTFQVAAGSVIGRNHVAGGISNQDAFAYQQSDEASVAVVLDGCSGFPYEFWVHSEIGAQLLAPIAARTIMSAVTGSTPEMPVQSDLFWANITAVLVTRIQRLAEAIGGDISVTVGRYLLCTLVGVVVTSDVTVTFALGDGIIVVNGEADRLGPYPKNIPPCLGYLAVGEARPADAPVVERIQQRHILPTASVHNVMIGTDGVCDIVDKADLPLPGRQAPQVVGPLSQFWESDRFFKNADEVRRRLSVINTDCPIPDWERQVIKPNRGLLPDDTTLVTIRRIPTDWEVSPCKRSTFAVPE